MKNKSHLQVRVLKSSIKDFEMLHWGHRAATIGTLNCSIGELEMF